MQRACMLVLALQKILCSPPSGRLLCADSLGAPQPIWVSQLPAPNLEVLALLIQEAILFLLPGCGLCLGVQIRNLPNHCLQLPWGCLQGGTGKKGPLQGLTCQVTCGMITMINQVSCGSRSYLLEALYVCLHGWGLYSCNLSPDAGKIRVQLQP